MTEPGYVYPPPPGWWTRQERIGTGDTSIELETSATGRTPPVDLYVPLRSANPQVGSMAMRHNFRRKPRAQTRRFLPTFDSIGAGTSTPGSTFTFSHTVSGNAVVVVGNFYNASLPTPVLTGNVGGVALTQLAVLFCYTTGGYNAYVGVAGCLNPPTGAQTVTLTTNSASYSYINSMSYANVGSFGTPNTAVGVGAGGLTAPAGDLIANVFSGYIYNFTAYNQNQRDNHPYNPGLALVAGDGPGGASFTASQASSWGGICVPMFAP